MTARFQPGVPTGGVDLDQDYINLQTNNTALNTIFGIDHLPFSNQTLQQGYHTTLHMVPISIAMPPGTNYPPTPLPTATPSYGQLFTAVTNDGFGTDTMLFFQTGFGVLLQLTSNITTINADNGISYLPGGAVYQWGRVPSTSSGSIAVGFTRPFTADNNVWNIQITRSGNSNSGGTIMPWVQTSSIDKDGFNIISPDGSTYSYYWTAIGR